MQKSRIKVVSNRLKSNQKNIWKNENEILKRKKMD